MKFIQTLIDFVIIACSVFLIIKGVTSARRKKEALPVPPPPPTKDQELLTEIRDLLKK